jgi:hypothetical protein
MTGSDFGVIVFQPTGGGLADVVIDGSTMSLNGSGVFVNGTLAAARIGYSSVTGNDRGLSAANGGAIVTYKTNKIYANATDGAPTTTDLLR